MTRLSFWHITLKDLLVIACSAAIPLALTIYSSIMSQEEQQLEENVRQLDYNKTNEARQQALYDRFIDNIYKLDKHGYLTENQTPWAFANAFYRAAHRQWDATRKGDVLQFLKERQLIGRSVCSADCRRVDVPDIIRLNELSWKGVRLLSQTGALNPVNLECIAFDQVLFNHAVFSSANLQGVSFTGGQSSGVKFEGGSSLRCAVFKGVDLRGVDFGDSDLTDTSFFNVDLSMTKLTKEQLEQAIFINCTLPTGISDEVKLKSTTGE